MGTGHGVNSNNYGGFIWGMKEKKNYIKGFA